MLKLFRLFIIVPLLAEAFCAAAPAPRTPAAVRGAFVAGPSIAAAEIRDGVVYSTGGFTLGLSPAVWQRAKGALSVESRDGEAALRCAFSGLVPFGVYSLFLGSAAQPSRDLQALDGAGTSNSFIATIGGNASVDVPLARPLGSRDVVVLVFHADGATYGRKPGQLGLDALEQLVAPVSPAVARSTTASSAAASSP